MAGRDFKYEEVRKARELAKESDSVKAKILEDLKKFRDIYPESSEAVRIFYQMNQDYRKWLISTFGTSFLKMTRKNISTGVDRNIKNRSLDYFEEMRTIAEGPNGSSAAEIKNALEDYDLPENYFFESLRNNPQHVKFEVLNIMIRRIEGISNEAAELQGVQIKTADQWREIFDIKEQDSEINEIALVFKRLAESNVAHLPVVKDVVDLSNRHQKMERIFRRFGFAIVNALMLWTAIEAGQSRIIKDAKDRIAKIKEEEETGKKKLETVSTQIKELELKQKEQENLLKLIDDRIKYEQMLLTSTQNQIQDAKKEAERFRIKFEEEFAAAQRRVSNVDQQASAILNKVVADAQRRIVIAPPVTVTPQSSVSNATNLEKPTNKKTDEQPTIKEKTIHATDTNGIRPPPLKGFIVTMDGLINRKKDGKAQPGYVKIARMKNGCHFAVAWYGGKTHPYGVVNHKKFEEIQRKAESEGAEDGNPQ